MSIPRGLKSLANDPVGTLSGHLANMGQHAANVPAYARNKGLGAAAVHLGTLPFQAVGIPFSDAHDEMTRGEWGKGLADLTFGAMVPKLPHIARGTGKVAAMFPGVKPLGRAAAPAARGGLNMLDRFMEYSRMRPPAASVPTPGPSVAGPRVGPFVTPKAPLATPRPRSKPAAKPAANKRKTVKRGNR